MAVNNIVGKEFSEKVLNSDKFVLVDFWAPWCMPCRMMAPVLDELAEDDDLSGNLSICKVDTEQAENQPLAMAMQIRSIPNLKLFYKGKIVEEFVGYQGLEQIKSGIQKAISKSIK